MTIGKHLVLAAIALLPSFTGMHAYGAEAPSGAKSVQDYLVDFQDLKKGTKVIVGPGRFACVGGSLCYLYDVEQLNNYLVIDISGLSRDDRKEIIGGSPVTGALHYLSITSGQVAGMPGGKVLSIVQ
ncbi:hypothetical protein [Asaia spathodeae]|uniref:Uncharacterized protein n=1 Tax=Asaia spathodeae TaxID=657016 RepID=A0ABX2P8K9_9PROT|nr:hypothetical protein [Asaia spathodeae]GBR19873.1 hypothetical protein AA105894_2421 [Asaia spathodeae NBRC 105894]